MAVMLNTSVGDLVIDLFTDQCPLATKNFLKLCKIKYYNHCIFHLVQKDFIVQTGDPTGTGSGGDSIYKLLYGDQARFFDDEIHPQLKHDKVGIVAMASAGENANASQFYITTRAELDYLDGKHTVFGEVGEGLETLMRINGAFVDEKDRPYKNIRIKHTTVLDDPFDDPTGLADLIPDKSPELKPPAEGEEVRLEDDWVPMDNNMDAEELERSMRRKEAQSRAVVLEMIGDLPEAEMKPPENVLFVCKLNPVTEEGDLEIIFGRFGKVMSADIIRDYKTGDSLCYAFIEFETQESCELAYFKMDNVLIDDRRIHVDFSQSVSHLWNRYRKLGAKGGDGQISNYRPGQGNGRGCFKCGEVGHFAKECPNNDAADEKEGVPEKPKYSIKDTGGQHGNAKKRYDMVFDEDAAEPRPVEKSEGKHGLDKVRVKNGEHKRKGDSRDRDSGRQFYAGRDDERPRQERQRERDRERLHESGQRSHNERREDDRGSDRHHHERDRNRPRDGGKYSHYSQHQERRGRAHDDDDRKVVNDTRDNARPSGASVRDFDRLRVDPRHAMEANAQEEVRKRRDTAKPLHEVRGDQDLEDSRNQRVIESKRQDDSNDLKKGGRSRNTEHSGEDYRNQRGLKESKQRNEDCGSRKVGQRSYREPSPDGRSNRKVEKRREREHSRDGYDDEGYSSRRRRH